MMGGCKTSAQALLLSAVVCISTLVSSVVTAENRSIGGDCVLENIQHTNAKTQCNETHVDENRICSAVNRSQLEQSLSVDSSCEALCNHTITEHACSLATHLTASNLVTLLNCSLESKRTDPVEVWKLFFQKASKALYSALVTYSIMAPNNSNPSLSHALDALGEVRIANFSQAQLQNDTFVSSWFQTKIRPFLASPSPKFLFCLGSKNFSCPTYQIVIQAFSSQMASMDRKTQQAVFTHFIKPFLSRNDSSDPGCVSLTGGSKVWLQLNLGTFSGFATLQDLQVLNANFSGDESLSALNPAQLAEFTLGSGALNDTEQIDRVFEQLQEGSALENVNDYLTQLMANEEDLDFQHVVRDRAMNRTFAIISPHFPHFKKDDWFDWFHLILVPVLPSFSPSMLKNVTTNMNCTNYHVVVSGMAVASPAMPLCRRKGITETLLGYMRKLAGVLKEPVCRQGIHSDAKWLEANLGPFLQYTSYSNLKVFNLSGVEVVDILSPKQKVELILDPDSGVLEDEVFVRRVLTNLTKSPDDEQLNQFFQAFRNISKQKNITLIEHPGVRDTILNVTLAALAPRFEKFKPEDFELWFQSNLFPVMASLHPGFLVVIPSNISCASYTAILTGLRQSLESLPIPLSHGLRSSIQSLKDTFPRCSVPGSFMCKETLVDENLICTAVNRSQLEETLSVGNTPEALCNHTITEHACSMATHLTASNLVTLMNCSLESERTYPVEVWKLFFQKASTALDSALVTYSIMAPNNSNPSLSHALDALGEVRIANFSQAQLQNDTFVSSWFQTKIRPFLASPSPNFLFCLGSKNFSCPTYQIVIQAFSSQMASMDRKTQKAVFTHFIKPFLSRNDSSDPGCVSLTGGSKEWLQLNLGTFSGFATLQDLQVLNANFSGDESLSALNPAQLAEFTLGSGALNDTEQIDRVFERLQEGSALENVNDYLTQLMANEEVPDFQPVVRDRAMNRTFAIISPHFPHFKKDDWFDWFHLILVPVLPSFSPAMLKNVTTNINCTNYHVVVSGMAVASPAMPSGRRKGITETLLGYMRKLAGVLKEPVCRQGIQSDAKWLEANLGPFLQYTSYSNLKVFNLSGVEVVDILSPKQKVELILDPDSGVLEDEVFVRRVLTNLTKSPDDEQLNQFFQAFRNISKQKNITLIEHPGVRDTILNVTLAALAPRFEKFKPEDFELWFQSNLFPVMASLHPGFLVVIPSNISCASYTAILTGLRQSLESLPIPLSHGLRSSIQSLKDTFPRCSVPGSFMCKETLVDENLICTAVNRSQLEETLSVGNTPEALCNHTITEHACSMATHLTASNLVTLMNCSLESERTYPVEVWKLFFQKASTALDSALVTYSIMAPNNSNPSLSHALDALGEVRIANFSQAQLQNDTFVSSWFQTKIRPFLASPSPNFLFCLGSKNFSCPTYQIVIQAFSSQMASMDRKTQKAVFTHFIKPFLSRNDSSDPGCVSLTGGSKEWLQLNLGTFSGFATLQDLQVLNANFSGDESLSALNPAQLAEFTLGSGALNDTEQIDRVFERLQEGSALENVNDYLTQLMANEEVPDFQPVVRDRAMNRTFAIISPHFPHFKKDDWFDWFHLILVPVLPSFSPAMLKNVTTNINCTNYHVVVSGMAVASPAMPSGRRKGITETLLGYMRKLAGVLKEPVCRQGIQSDAKWLEANLGPFLQYTSYSNLKVFNLSGVEVVDILSPKQKVELILDPDSGVLEDEVFVRRVLTNLTKSPDDEQLNQFFQAFRNISKQKNITLIEHPGVRDTILNVTLAALAPRFEKFKPEDFELWFQSNLFPVMASLHPGFLVVIPSNISCASYTAILTGLRQSLESLPIPLSHGLRSSIQSLKDTFPRCSVPGSFMCKETLVDENLICTAVNRSQLEETLSVGNTPEALCNHTITEHACSMATHLTASNLVTLMNCSLESERTYPVEVWKLFFQKASTALDSALVTYSIMAPNNSNPSLSHALDALGEVRIANFSQAQLQNDTFVSSWFQTKIRPFLASPSPNFLFCLGSKNFSCPTYQIVIQAFSSQMASMDRKTQKAVFTHFIKPFLSRNDSSDPGCVSLTGGSKEWLQLNLGTFSGFATLQDLQVLNANFSGDESLSALNPAQLAEFTLGSGALNDTEQIDRVFERLQEGSALENVNDYLTQLMANEEVPDFQPVVRDRAMNRTFAIISPHFPHFKKDDWFDWFHLILVPVLPSFSPSMLKNVTTNINCTNYHVVVSGMAVASPAMPLCRRKGITETLLGYMRKLAGVLKEPVCRQGIQSDAKWLEANLGPFLQYTSYSNLKVFNLSGVEVVDILSPKQKVELILDPDSGVLEDEVFVRRVLTNLTKSPDDEQLNQFFQAFRNISKQKNITLIEHPGVRDTILNVTLAALAPRFEKFKPEDFELWFQSNLFPVMASLHPGFLVVIPSNISCASYTAILTGLRQSLESLPIPLSHGLRSSIQSLKDKFPRCSVPGSFMCKETLVDENLICTAVNRSQLEETLSVGNTPEALCNHTITEHACSMATHLTASNLVTLMNCSLESERTYPVEVWKLFFQKASTALDSALVTYSIMAPNNSNPSLSHAIDALGEVRIANFSQAQLQNDTFVSSWFQTKIRPFLASPSPNFLFCLGSKNFSCPTYQIVIQAFSSQMASMDRKTQQAVFTHFINPFLSRNDSSDPGCVSLTGGSKEWLQLNLGTFSGFATLQDLQVLNANFSGDESLSALNPAQLAEFTLGSGALKDTEQIDRVFERLQEGSALENVNDYLTQLMANEEVPDFQPVVRDRAMNRTFAIISPHFPHFKKDDWFDWFHLILVPVLPSFSPAMLKNVTTNMNCTNYHVVVSGMAVASPAMPSGRRKGITETLLGYMRKLAGVLKEPVCRQGIQSDAKWLEANLGPFLQYTSYSNLKVFNLSGVEVVDILSPKQKVELILDPDSGVLEDEVFVRRVLTNLTKSPDDEQLNQFFQAFRNISKQKNITLIEHPGVRDTILNVTLAALAPRFGKFKPEDFELWFQSNLFPVMASLHPGFLVVIPSNISCASYTAILAGLRQSLESLPIPLSHGLRSSIQSLKDTFPRCSVPGSFMCKETLVDENLICTAVNRSQLEETLSVGNTSEALCNHTITEHACSLATHLTAGNLVTLMNCSLESERTYPVEVWKLFFQKASTALDSALVTFSSMAPNNSNPSLSHALDALGEVRIANFSQAELQNDTFVSSWFQTKIRPFLASPSPNFLFCLGSKNFSCPTYQIVIQAFSSQMASMDRKTQQAVFTHFIKPFLSRNDSSDPGCVSLPGGSKEWLQVNLGTFSGFATLQDLQVLNANFSGMEVVDLLTLDHLATLAATPSQLKTKHDVTKIMTVINPVDFGAFFDIVSPAIERHQVNYTVEVKSAFLQEVFDRGNLSSPALNDTEFLLWLRVRLSPLLVNLSPKLVTPLFDIGKNRSCNSIQEIITFLDTQHSTLSNNTQHEIFKNILVFLQGPVPLKCYRGGSFYIYLRNTFLRFGFPDVSMFTSLLPKTQESELLSTISTSELNQFLSQPNVIGNNSDICVIFNNYNNTPAFLENEDVPDDVRMVTLPCVWPLALRSNTRSEVDSWFNLRLRKYLRFLTKSLISPNTVQNASCLAFQKLVYVMGNNFTYNSEFGPSDVYTTISTYLRTGSEVRCYNASDAELNSTAWFVNYIGNYVTFITVDDLTAFISPSEAKVFLVDQANLELFNNTAIPENVTDYYISQLFEFNPTFNPLKVPGFFLCSSEVPSSAYSSLSEDDTELIMNQLTHFCNGVEDPEVSAALASNIQTVTAGTFETLGNATAGLTSSQITSVPPSVLVSSLGTLGSVSTWNQEQATTIILALTASGFQINSGSSLESLGTLIAGVPSGMIEKIPASELHSVSQSSTFVTYMLAAPTVVQQVFVQKIISVDSSAASVVQNVPDAMATEIPPSLLVLSAENVDTSVINRKEWTRDQASMFYGTLAETTFDIEQLTPSVLQGFTCTSVRKMRTKRKKRLIRACRPRKRRAKVHLKESQLTCMYNLFNGNISQNFSDYPSDMLLYLKKKDIKSGNCRSYFSTLAAADFSVASSVLNKDSLLLSEARTCLGISGENLSRDDVELLGNMACTLDSSYIKNADPLVLEKLKNCKDFSDSQVTAMETLLLSGKTKYGKVETWNKETLTNLGILPLYLTRNTWGKFKTSTKRKFLKTFMRQLRNKKTKKRKLKALFRQINADRRKRGAGCTVGNITQVTVSDDSFPFGYDETQFDLCLDSSVLKDNLNSICEKVDDDDFQKIVLKKLNQTFPSGVSDENVQVLGSVSRVASLDDISKWNITKVDTLAALMNTDDGSWETEKSKAIITKYLNTSGNSLGSIELNSIDSNLCSLDTSTLKTITPESIRNAKPLNVASCSPEQKRVLYEISNTSFSSHRSSPTAYYNLINPFLGGAPLSDVVALSTQNISMDIDTFQSLDSNVISDLTVTDVKGLMGSHLQDLKLFENTTQIQTWINGQLQADLDTLGLDLTTHRSDTTTAPPSSNSSTNAPTTAAATTVAATTGNPSTLGTSQATTVTSIAGDTSSLGTTLATTVTTTPATTTSGGSQLAKYQTTIFVAALLTTVLQIL